MKEIKEIELSIGSWLSRRKYKLKKENYKGDWKELEDYILKDVEVLSWESEYFDPFILDGTQWELKITFENNAFFESGGSNDYPINFNDLLKVLQQKEFLSEYLGDEE